MKIFFSLTDSLGGVEQLLLKLMKDDPKNSKICFWGNKSIETWNDAGLETYYCNNKISRLYKYCKTNPADKVFSSHIMMNSILGTFRSLGILKTVKLICRESTTIFSRYEGLKLFQYKIAYFLGYRKIDLLITQSNLMKEVLSTRLPYLNNRVKKIETIPNLFLFPEKELVEQEIEMPSNSIVAAGRLIPEKGFDILIQSFEKLLETQPELNLVILGEGEERKTLEKIVNNLGLNDKVHLVGFVTNVYPYFKKAQACVVSSRIEGFPNVLLQMMSQNERIVSTLCAGGIEELKGVTTCGTNNVIELTNAIKQTLEKKIINERDIFDEELKSRSIDAFNNRIEKAL